MSLFGKLGHIFNNLTFKFLYDRQLKRLLLLVVVAIHMSTIWRMIICMCICNTCLEQLHVCVCVCQTVCLCVCVCVCLYVSVCVCMCLSNPVLLYLTITTYNQERMNPAEGGEGAYNCYIKCCVNLYWTNCTKCPYMGKH